MEKFGSGLKLSLVCVFFFLSDVTRQKDAQRARKRSTARRW